MPDLGVQLTPRRRPALSTSFWGPRCPSCSPQPGSKSANDRQRQVDKDYHHRAKELDSGFGGDSSDGFEAELSSYGKRGEVLGPVVGAYGEMSDDVYVIAEAVAEELATEHCGFYSDKKQGVVAAFFLSQIYRPWGLVAHRGLLTLRVGAPYARPPVPCRSPQRAPPPCRARLRRSRLRRGDRPR